MKRSPIIFLLGLLLGLCVIPCRAQESAALDPQKLLEEAETKWFRRDPFWDDYGTPQGIVNEIKGPHLLNQTYIEKGNSIQTIFSLLPAEEDYSNANKYAVYNKLHLSDFHLSLRMTLEETVQPESGYCWISYDNGDVVGTDKASGVRLRLGDGAYAFKEIDGTDQEIFIADMSAFHSPGVWNKVDIIRLDGITYVYVDDIYQFAYQDGISEKFSWKAGTTLKKGGEHTTCMFDNFRLWQR